MADYSTQTLAAYNQISAAGATIIIRKWEEEAPMDEWDPITENLYNFPNAPATLSTWVEYTTVGVLTSYKEERIDGELIKVGDMVCLVPAYGLTIELQPGDQIEMSSVRWVVQNPNPVMPDGDPIIYKAQVRK